MNKGVFSIHKKGGENDFSITDIFSLVLNLQSLKEIKDLRGFTKPKISC